jgi:tetratricopeptide (TPR) repeat protein
MNNTELHRPTYKGAIVALWKSAMDKIVVLSVIVTVLAAFTDFKYTKEHPVLIGMIAIIAIVFLSMLLLIHQLITYGVQHKAPFVLSLELVGIINTLYEEEKFLDVVRFGSTISRYLWINGHNKERIAIGELVEDAASKESRVAEQVAALIDDIGWTYYIVGDATKAITNITNGVEKALENELFYFAAKGERHLAGISKHNNKINDFTQHLTNAETYTAKILDKSDKNEMEASLLLARAKYFFETQALDEAEITAKKAMDIFRNDLDRIVKVHQLLGNIYAKQGKIQKAKDEFNKGYESSKNIRKDEFAKNAVGLAKIALSEGDIKTYTKYLNEARVVYISHHKNKEVNEIDIMLKSIRT